jgi:probable phosphoglycerate mutase
MKTVYFVRHGETAFNKEKRFQDADTPLGARGVKQAEFVAKRFKTISIEAIIVSHMLRARQTAEAIARETGREIVESELFHEVLRPSAVRGKHWDDTSIAEIVSQFHRYFGDEVNKHSDEENFYDVKRRALAALRFIEARPESSICVVTHGMFLKALMSVMMRDENTDHDFFMSINSFHYPSNTGITKCEWGRFRDGEWTLHTWNDDAHLGEVIE